MFPKPRSKAREGNGSETLDSFEESIHVEKKAGYVSAIPGYALSPWPGERSIVPGACGRGF